MPFPRMTFAAASRAAVVLALAAWSALAASGCDKKQQDRKPRVPVAVATAVERAMPFSLTATGSIEAIETAQVGSQVGGMVTRVGFQEGAEVHQGDVLFELDPRLYRAAYEELKASLARDRAQAHAARLDAQRSQMLYEQQLTSQAEYEQKTAAAEGLDAAVAADSASLEAARLNVQYATVRAPISGRTGRLLVHVGDYVKAATSEPLVTINRVDPVRVRFAVPQDVVPQIARHRDAAYVVIHTSDADSVGRRGRLAFVDNAVDPASGTLTLKGEFDNRDRSLVPGQFVDVRLVLYTDPKAVIVPSPAITTGPQGPYVYVLNADSTVSPRPVGVSRAVDELTILTNGLKAGETVVTDGQLRLSPGARVIVRSGGGFQQ